MKKFIFKILIFLFPIVLVFLPPFLILKGSGENYTDINPVIRNNADYLIGYAYNENNYKYLKWATINENNKYQIIALGSSRVLQFRDNMFKSSFYNAGYTISKIGDFKKFLQSIPIEKYPKYLILGFDQWMFNENWDNGIGKDPNSNYWSNSFSKQPKFNTFSSIYKDLFKGKYGLSIIVNNSTKIGLNAIVNDKGFRNDGSIYYGTQIRKLINNDNSANDFEFNDTYSRIKNGNRRFQYGEKVNQIAVDKLNQLLSFCKDNNINVIGFIPPFANSVYEKMNKSNNYNYLNDLSKKLTPIFNEYGFEFYNYPSVKYCNSTDNENIDGFHGGEVVYCNILIDMLKNNSIINEVTNIEKLENDKKNKKNRYIVYE